MKSYILRYSITIKCLCIVASMLLGQAYVKAQSDKPGYNKRLADSIGADDYGMKMYVLVILKTGKGRIDDKKKIDSLFAGHLKNIGHLAEIGKMVVAGPLETNEHDFRGIFILNAKTIAEANELLQTDPAIKANLLYPELFQWYGSAALPMYLPFHSQVQKKEF